MSIQSSNFSWQMLLSKNTSIIPYRIQLQLLILSQRLMAGILTRNESILSAVDCICIYVLVRSSSS